MRVVTGRDGIGDGEDEITRNMRETLTGLRRERHGGERFSSGLDSDEVAVTLNNLARI